MFQEPKIEYFVGFFASVLKLLLELSDTEPRQST